MTVLLSVLSAGRTAPCGHVVVVVIVHRATGLSILSHLVKVCACKRTMIKCECLTLPSFDKRPCEVLSDGGEAARSQILTSEHRYMRVLTAGDD